MDYNLKEVVLGAFFHDIGKFLVRAKKTDYRSNSMESILCPVYEGKYSHKHVLYTDGFIEKYKNSFPKCINVSNVQKLASMHHNPFSDDPVSFITQEADIIASGSERVNSEENDPEGGYIKKPITSVFSYININQKNENDICNYELQKMSVENCFPKKDIAFSVQKYSDLFSNFKVDFELLYKKNYNYEDYIVSLDNLFKTYMSFIPSSTLQRPDISLYDHSSLTSAFSSVLFNYHKEKNTLNNAEEIKNRKDKKFKIITGDLSGIQKYIFNIKSTEKSSKILRAKSFELQALFELVSKYILDSLNLPCFCNLLNAGGRFCLLVPNTEETKKQLEKIRKKINVHMKEEYNAELSIIISEGVCVSPDDLLSNSSRDSIKELFQNMFIDSEKSKNTKFLNILQEPKDYILDFDYNCKDFNEVKVCKSCESRPVSNDSFCKKCNNLVKIGSVITKSKSIFCGYSSRLKPESFHTEVVSFENHVFVLSTEEDLIFSINNYLPTKGYFGVANFVPRNEEKEILSFEDLSKKSRGNNKIAMLKADVDNLSSIFIFGFGDNISFSRQLALSRFLNYFFSTYLSDFLSKEYENIYTVFSGGDDLCLIGPWNEIINLSKNIKNKFDEFVGYNSSFTISCGISLANHNLPVSFIAKEAENFLEKSKENNKNSITIFEQTLTWKDFNYLLKNSEEFLNDFEEDKSSISKSFVYRLIYYSNMKKKFESVKFTDFNGVNWRSLLKYDLVRNIKSEDMKNKLTEIIEKYIDKIKFLSSYILHSLRN